MIRDFLEQLFAGSWNRLRRRHRGAWQETGSLDLGLRVFDEQVSRGHVSMSSTRRTMHVAVLGKTGSGKSSFLRYLAEQDIEADRGFAYFDLHGDATPLLLRAINARERRELSASERQTHHYRTCRPDCFNWSQSLGIGYLDFVRVTEFAQVLKQRWGLDHFGARTEELLRNSL